MMGAIKRFYDHSNATLTSSGSANTQTLTYAVAPTGLVAGDCYAFIAGFTNTGATTLNVNGLGATAIQVGASALGGGEIVAGSPTVVFYNGSVFQLLLGAITAARGTVSKTAAYTLAAGDAGTHVSLGGNDFYSLTIPSAVGFPAGTRFFVSNRDQWSGGGRGKFLNFTTQTFDPRSLIIFPQNSAWIVRDDIAQEWRLDVPPRAKLPSGAVTFYYDPANGSDSSNARDGLAPFATSSTGPLASANGILSFVSGRFDFNTQVQTFITCLNVAGGADTTQVHYAPHAVVGAQGGAAVTLDLNGGSLLPTAGDAIEVYYDAISIQNGTIGAPTSGVGISALRGGKIVLGSGLTLGALSATGIHLMAAHDGQIILNGNITITGGAASGYVMYIAGGSIIGFPGAAFTLGANVSFTAVHLLQGANAALSGVTWNLAGHTLTAAICAGSGANTFSHALTAGGGIARGTLNSATTFTPTITASSGTFTSVSATGRYTQINADLVEGQMTITITTAGTASGILIATIPTAGGAQDNTLGYGVDQFAIKSLIVFGGPSTGQLLIQNYDGSSCIQNGAILTIRFQYQGYIS